MDDRRKRQFQFSGGYWLLGFAALLLLQSALLKGSAPKAVAYDEFLKTLRAGKLAKVELRQSEMLGELKPEDGKRPARILASRLPGMDETGLVKELQETGVSFAGRIEKTSWLEGLLLGWLLPIGILMAVYFYFMSRMGRGMGPLSLGKNKAKIYDESQHGRVTFADVAGVDEARAELVEVVDFLKNPTKYRALGARIPKGVLLVGPPGTGKTLLAKAVAGEAGVPFFSMSGSEFVEMFVGLGAARMRDLFVQAKDRAPCIVFIDELDAIGKSRGGVAALATHDEREQTLNQLLVEIDGFDGTKGVILMGATNRPEVLDPALLRAGRFDRQVVVDRPDVRGREEILKVHARKAKLDESVDLKLVAQRTPGMVGADLERVVNEAALAAARRGSPLVGQHDFEEAVDRLQLGLKKQGSLMSPDEKRRVAFHEGGHTLVALSLPHADPVHRVTIIPRSIGALGVTLQLPSEERYLMTKDQLLDRVCVMMGGRAAEELAFGDVSTGAHNDLERASETVRQMVCRFGMSEALGPVTFGRAGQSRFLAAAGLGEERNFSEETARQIDTEVRKLLEEQYARARAVLTRRRVALDTIAGRLLEVETLDRPELERLVAGASSITGRPRSWPARSLVGLLALALASVPAAAGDVTLDAEAGPVWQTRNDFRIPGDGGTLVELAEVDSGPFGSFRGTLTWELSERQSLRLLAAPLTVETSFTPASPVAFQDLVFPAGQPTQARYVFNSYRLSWYWRFAPERRWSFRLGATLKVRDAEIGLSGAPGRSVKDDLGVVPLLYAQARYQATERLALEAEADALAAPQGRAEDVSVKAVLRLNDAIDLDVGYRFLEGGADNDEVFTFGFFHYAVAGLRIRF